MNSSSQSCQLMAWASLHVPKAGHIWKRYDAKEVFGNFFLFALLFQARNCLISTGATSQSCAVSWCHHEDVMGEGLDLQDPVLRAQPWRLSLSPVSANHCKTISLGIILSLCCCCKRKQLQWSLLLTCLVLISLFFSPSTSCSLVVGCWGRASAPVGDSESVTGGMVSEFLYFRRLQ